MAPNASAIKNNLIAAFGISGVNHSDIDNNTACVVHTELSGTNLSPEDIEGVQITITVSKDWFNVVAANEVSNVWIFKINRNTNTRSNHYTVSNINSNIYLNIRTRSQTSTVVFDIDCHSDYCYCGHNYYGAEGEIEKNYRRG
ncbi:MAG: hypothetical protein U9O85_04865 [Euryarchaeota archaeon]|nr:hypothetical protein [Euryarchaeota archaeon]